jgi:hypothetical protein
VHSHSLRSERDKILVNQFNYISRVTAIVGLLATVGCGGSGKVPQEVSGQILFQKQPLHQGMIEFVPATAEDSLRTRGAPIADGRYTIPRAARLLPGSYHVKVIAIGTSPVQMLGLSPEQRKKELSTPVPKIPEKYNVHTVLTAEVGEKGQQTLDFNLD